MKKIVIFGAGNIGRGFIGAVFSNAGWDVVFVDVRRELVDMLNERHGYPLRILETGFEETGWISNVRAVPFTDPDGVAQEVVTADFACMCVGAANMETVASHMVPGLVIRAERGQNPLDLMLAENRWDGKPAVRTAIEKGLVKIGRPNMQIGIVESSIGRMVPVQKPEWLGEDPLLVCVEAYDNLPVDADGFVGQVPDVPNLQPRRPFEGYVARKLFVHNCGHAAAAYLGWHKNLTYIWEVMEDDEIRDLCLESMACSCKAIHRRYGLELSELLAHRDDLARRFGNRRLGDQITRVASDPMRKLKIDDRLLGAVNLCLEEGVDPEPLRPVVNAALHYRCPDDLGSVGLAELVAEKPLDEALAQIAGIPETNHPVIKWFVSGPIAS